MKRERRQSVSSDISVPFYIATGGPGCVGVSPVAYAYRADRKPLIRLLVNPASVLLSVPYSAAGEIRTRFLLSLFLSFSLSPCRKPSVKIIVVAPPLRDCSLS